MMVVVDSLNQFECSKWRFFAKVRKARPTWI